MINELEFANGLIWGNIYTTNYIIGFNPLDG